ncbi:hypothetical protein, partial [Actinobacillus pleuropneumoniae]
ALLTLESNALGCVIMHFPKGGPTLLPIGGFFRIPCAFHSILWVYNLVFVQGKWYNSLINLSPHREGD